MFTWGRGNYGQLGRQISASEDIEQQPAGPAAQGGTQEVGLPAEVENLRGATQGEVSSRGAGMNMGCAETARRPTSFIHSSFLV